MRAFRAVLSAAAAHVAAAGRAFGALPAVVVVAPGYAAFAGICLFAPDALVGDVIAFGAPLLILLHCSLRPFKRGLVLVLAMAPNAVAVELKALFGAPPWAGWLLAPIVLVALVAIDRRGDRESVPGPDPDRAAAASS